MHTPSQQHRHQPHTNALQPPILPYQRLPFHLPKEMSIQQFIKEWIERIFLKNYKIESEARMRMTRQIAKFKLFEHSSCSSVYELIRHKIEQIAQKLRSFVDNSYTILSQRKQHLSHLTQQNMDAVVGEDNQKKEEGLCSERIAQVPIAKMVVLFYKYICNSLKQVCNLWKIIYPSISVRDLEKSTFQKSISTFVLQIFSAPSKAFSPLKMYPSMSLMNKVRFICANPLEGISRRLELTKFSEQEMKRAQLQKKSKMSNLTGINLEDLNDSQRRLLEEIKEYPYLNRKSIKAQQKLKVDIPFIEELKNKIANAQQTYEQPVTGSLQQYCEFDEVREQCRNVKAELLTPFEHKPGLLYEMEDNSSQQELDNFYDDKEGDNDELYLQSQDILMEYLTAKAKSQHKENDGSAKLSSSTANDQNNECSELKHEDLEIHNDHARLDIIQDQQDQESQATDNQEERALTKQLTGQMIQIKNQRIKSTLDFPNSLILGKKNEKLIGSETSKRYLQEQKHKLEKYRKELEKEKEELLREVQRFMKQKERDERNYKRVNHCFNFTNNRKPIPICACCHRLINHDLQVEKTIVGSKEFHSSCSKTLEYEKQQMNEGEREENSVQQQIANEIYKNMNAQSFEDYSSERNEEMGGSSRKKKQKNKKKLEKQLQHKTYRIEQKSVPVNDKPMREIDEYEAQLIKFMENLKINDATRVTWNIEESRIESWKERLVKIRNNQTVIRNNPKKQQPKPEKSKKKQKR